MDINVLNMDTFSENDIRPEFLLSNQQKLVLMDIGRLLTHADRFVEVNCPACDMNNTIKKYEKYGLTFVECTKCGTIYTNPRPTIDILDEFYKNSLNYEYWNNYIFPASENIRRQKIFIPRVDKTIEFCKKYSIHPESILEIGAGFGTFCVELKSRELFTRIVAVEPTHNLAETLRNKNICVVEEIIENINFDESEKFDVVVNFEVIEHLFSAKNFIKQCRSFLKDNGLLIITCPNGKGFDFEILGDKCNSLDHEHLNYFNPLSLSILLEKNQFEVLETLTPGRLDAELVRKKIISGELDVSKQPFLNTVLVEKWDQLGDRFQNFLVEAGLSSNLWVIARAK